MKSPPWLLPPNNDETAGFVVDYYAGFVVVGVTPPNNPPETTCFGF